MIIQGTQEALPREGSVFAPPFVKQVLNATDGGKECELKPGSVRDNRIECYNFKDVSGTAQKDRDANMGLLWESASDEKSEDALLLVENTLSDEDDKELSADGDIMTEYTEEALARALARIREGRELFSERTEEIAENLSEARDNIKKQAISNLLDNVPASRIVEDLLAESGLPFTPAMVERLSAAVDFFDKASASGNDVSQYLIKNELPPTPENLYRAAYAGSLRSRRVSDGIFEKMQPAIKKLADDAGLPADQKTMADAKLLLENDIPVTASSLSEKAEIGKVMSLTREEVAEQLINSLPYGKDPAKVTLESAWRDAKNAAKLFDSIISISAKSIYTLIKHGGVPDLENLGEIRDGLKQLEDDYYKKLLSEYGFTAENEDDESKAVSTVRDTLEGVRAVKSAPADLLAVTFASRFEITAEGLFDNARAMTAAAKEADNAYEKMMTSPRRDLGDSVTKAFENISSLLDTLSIEDTLANERAARILGRNGMEISEENLFEIKYYDLKVTTFVDKMTPGVVAKMVKNGFNPLEHTVDGCLDEAIRLSEASDEASDEKYAEFLYRLERSGSITQDEKSAFIGIYRLLYQLQSGDSAAIGAVTKNGEEFTLSNLLKAVRTRKAGGIDGTVDDSFGGMQGGYRFDVEHQINDYYLRLTRTVMEADSPDKLREERAERVRTAMGALKEEGALLRELNLPDSTIYREAMHGLLSSPDFFRTIGKKTKTAFEASPYEPFSDAEDEPFPEGMDETLVKGNDSREMLSSYYSDLVESARLLVEEKASGGLLSSADFNLLRTVSTGLTLRSKLADRGFFDIPVSINGEEGRICLRFREAAENEAPGLEIKIESASGQSVSIQASVTENVFSYTIDRDLDTKALDERLEALLKDRENSRKITGETLYKAAKIFIDEAYKTV